MILNNGIKHLRWIVMMAVILVFAGSMWLTRSARARSDAEWTTATNGTDIYNANSGNVGIGTTTPAGLFDVNGKLTVSSSGSVGIGTTTPGSLLHLFSSTSSAQLKIETQSSSFLASFLLNGPTGFLDSRWVDTGGAGTSLINTPSTGVFRTTGVGLTFINASSTGYVRFATGGAATSNERMRIDPSGNVGIGITAPTSKLSVGGDIDATGVIKAKYQDVAEWVPSSQTISGGTVVILDPSKNNNVIPSVKAYDTRVAGVVSDRPGLLLGEGGAGKAMVATTGRVKVKVDTTRSAIAIGDLLVTSGLSGYAMRSEPVKLGGVEIHRPGTLIGKALEAMPKGKKGEILVLLSLQ